MTPETETKVNQNAGFAGLKVVSFESRRAFEMKSLVERMGGQVFAAPSMREIPFEVNQEAADFCRKAVEGKVDLLVLMTGVGTQYLAQVAETQMPKERFVEALSKITLAARGPKPVLALKELGLTPHIIAPEPNTWREVLSALDTSKFEIKDKKVFVQEYGIQNREFIQELKKRGARVTRVPVYRWALPEDTSALRKAAVNICEGQADVLLFTNATQIHHLLQVAAEEGLESSLRESMGRVVVASIGPVVTENLKDIGLPVDFESVDSKMGLFVKEASEKCPAILAEKRARWDAASQAIEFKKYDIQSFHDDWCSDSIFMRACRNQPTKYTPVWLMRQAGRYMKEYRDIRARVSFLQLCKTPDLACEVTVTAQERLNTDAAILFSDILLLVEPMGIGLEFSRGEGPNILRPVRAPEDVDRVREVNPAESLPFVYEAIRKIRTALNPKIPLIGFAGAPFTVVSYMVEGKGAEQYLHTKKLMRQDPGAWNALMEKVTRATAAHLNGQVEAGAQVVQLFDSWVGCLSPEEYRAFVLPHMKNLFAALPAHVPTIHFGTETAGLLPLMKEAGGSVMGLDWRVDIGAERARLGGMPVQGNLDPTVLLSDQKTIREHVFKIVQAAGHKGHIFNLGHGILPQTPVDNAVALVKMVHELTQG